MSCERSRKARSENEDNLSQLLAMTLNEVMRLDETSQQLFSNTRLTRPTPSPVEVGKAYSAGGKRKRDEIESLETDNVENLDSKRRRGRMSRKTHAQISQQAKITLGKPTDFNVFHGVKKACGRSGNSLWEKVVRAQHGRMCHSMLGACVMA
ncbi:uncharacterized protein LOC143470923 [Clavelina lepadiformis]|uniref:uncharacterized protein LOC143470923 n=1 Tax=Clavelina lepadiformis TaxID=159417 RepID=UPI00404393CC